jgi:hypothetical protein
MIGAGGFVVGGIIFLHGGRKKPEQMLEFIKAGYLIYSTFVQLLSRSKYQFSGGQGKKAPRISLRSSSPLRCSAPPAFSD